MKKIISIIVAVLILASFVACNNVSENLKNDIVLLPIEEIMRNTPKTAKLTHNKLNFDGNVIIPEVSETYKLAIRPNDEWFNNYEKLLEKVTGEIGNENSFKIVDYKTFGEIPFYEQIARYEDSEKYSYSVSNNGRIVVHRIEDYKQNPADWATWHTAFGQPKCIYDNLKNLSEDSFKLYDKEISIKDAVVKFQSDLDKFTPLLPENQSAELRYISVYLNDSADCYQLYAEGVINYKDMAFNHVCVFSQNAEENNNNSIEYSGFQSCLTLAENDPFISEIQNSFIVMDELETYDKLLSFESAWEILCDKVAKERKTKISSAELVYLPYFEDKSNFGSEWSRNLTEPPAFYAKPVWCFAERTDSEKDENSAQKNAVFYVDAVTGEMSSYSPYVIID